MNCLYTLFKLWNTTQTTTTEYQPVVEAVSRPLIDIDSTLFDAKWQPHYPLDHGEDGPVESQLGAGGSAGGGGVSLHAERGGLHGESSRRPSLTLCP